MVEEIWIADDDASICWVLEKSLALAGYTTQAFSRADDLLSALQHASPAAVFTDVRMPGKSGLEMLQQIKIDFPSLPVIVMTAYSDLDTAVGAYQKGAFDYLPKPFDVDDAISLLERALAEQHALTEVTKKEPDSQYQQQIIGSAPSMQDVFRTIGRLSHSNISVLIRGESGTGKELVATALHQSSPRKHKPFIEINTAAIPAELLESELFGHEKGAFTGAHSLRRGRFEQADGGTLFLDEIGDMPLELQTRLLRVLSEKRFFRVGGREQLDVDVRVIAATNQNLEAQVEAGEFRLDLFHRLNVVSIELPPLSMRTEDIEQLAQFFFEQAAKEFSVKQKLLASDALRAMQSYAWPGNIRELQNLCKRLTVMAPGHTIRAQDLPDGFGATIDEGLPQTSWQPLLRQYVLAEWSRGVEGISASLQPEYERLVIDAALQMANGHKQNAAKLLGWGRNTLTRKIQELGIKA